jgi:hypothetical protein
MSVIIRLYNYRLEEIAPGGGVDRQYIEINRYGVYEDKLFK